MVLSMSLFTLAVTQPKKMLTNLRGWLESAQSFAQGQEFDPTVLLQYRFAPNMFPFARQVQISCDTAKLTAARLSGKDAPSHEDTETTIDELSTRIASTVAFLDTLTEADFAGAEERLIPLRFAPGKASRGAEYFTSFAQPNFYFHITTAYALLRHAGVPIGKRTFIGSMEMEDLPADG